MTITIDIKQTDELILPAKANSTDAGYDVIATSEPNIVGTGYTTKQGFGFANIDYIEYDTNIHIEPKWRGGGFQTEYPSFHTLIHPRSSISKSNLVLANSIGLIDEGYRDSIKLRFKYIYQPEDLILLNDEAKTVVPIHIKALTRINRSKIYRKGNKIGQLVFAETIHAEFNIVKNLTDDTNRGGGFGSSDKPQV